MVRVGPDASVRTGCQLECVQPSAAILIVDDHDRVVPPASAWLDDPHYNVASLLTHGCCHLMICRDVRFIRSPRPEFARSETLADPAVPAGAGRNLMAA